MTVSWLLLATMLLLMHSTSSFQPAHNTRRHHSSKLASSAHHKPEKPYFLRKAVMADLSFVAQILADGFYDDRNPASKWWEKLQTQMSLESNLPNAFLKHPHEMWVACDSLSHKIVAFCEVDNRPPKPTMPPGQVRPYMCNLAVDVNWRNKGLAKDMIRQCEASVESWQDVHLLHLKVREHNEPAVKLYSKMGYNVASTQIDEKTCDTLLVMKREWTMTTEDASSATTVSEENAQKPMASLSLRGDE